MEDIRSICSDEGLKSEEQKNFKNFKNKIEKKGKLESQWEVATWRAQRRGFSFVAFKVAKIAFQ